LAKQKNTNIRELKEVNQQEVYAGKVPPHSKELEMNILGGMMIDNAMIDAVSTIIQAKHFYFASNGLVYQAICDLRDRNEPVDSITLTEELKARGELEAVGGPFYIAELSNAFSSLETIVYSSNKILENWIKRDLILLTHTLNEQCYDPTLNTENLLDKAQQQILEITN
jgi:replicative DNA helicase